MTNFHLTIILLFVHDAQSIQILRLLSCFDVKNHLDRSEIEKINEKRL